MGKDSLDETLIAEHTPFDFAVAGEEAARRTTLDNDPVATAVAEFNRYNHTQMQVDDPDLAGVRISGVFNTDDPDALVKYLKEVQGVRAQQTGGGVVLSR